jgi:hypothetical protein
VREGIRRIPDFWGPPDSKKTPNETPKAPPKEVEAPKKERKGFFGLFGSKKADPETAPKPRPPPSIQTPPTVTVPSNTVDAGSRKVVEEVRDLEAQARLDRIEEQFLLFEHQLNARLSERENSYKNLDKQLMRFERSRSPNPSVIVELQNRLGDVENQCSELEKELESQGDRITELENEVWRARVQAVGVERKLISSVDSLRLKTSKSIDSKRMEVDRLKVLIEENVMRSCRKDCVRCELHSDCPMDGIISYLTKKYGGNVSELNIVGIKSEMVTAQLKCVADLDHRISSSLRIVRINGFVMNSNGIL